MFNSLLTNSQGEEVKKELFIEEKISFAYPQLSKSHPEINVVDKDKVLHLKRDLVLKKGDLIYSYQNEKVTIFIDKDSENILGILSQ